MSGGKVLVLFGNRCADVTWPEPDCPVGGCGLALRVAAHVREQLNLNAPVFLAARGRVGRGYILILADADQVEAVRRDAVFRGQVLHHRISAALAEVVVVLRGTNQSPCRRSLQECGALRRTKRSRKRVQLALVIGRQRCQVEAERHGNRGHLLVVVEALDYGIQRVGAVRATSEAAASAVLAACEAVCASCCAVSRRALRVRNAHHGAIAHVFNLPIVVGGLLIQLIGVIDQRSCLRPHVVFGGASRHAKRHPTPLLPSTQIQIPESSFVLTSPVPAGAR